MENLVFLSSKGNPITDSLQVALAFDKPHYDVLKAIRTHLEKLDEIEPGFREGNFSLSSYKTTQGKEMSKYVMTEEGCMSLVLTFTTKKALIVQRAYMKEFNRMKEYIKQQQAPKELSPLEQISQALLLADNMIKEQQLVIAELEPPALLGKSIVGSEDLIYIKDLAIILKENGYNTGEKRFFAWLRGNGYLCRNNAPTQRSLNLKVLERVEYEQDGKLRFVTKVTGKGQEYFVNKFLKEQ